MFHRKKKIKPERAPNEMESRKTREPPEGVRQARKIATKAGGSRLRAGQQPEELEPSNMPMREHYPVTGNIDSIYVVAWLVQCCTLLRLPLPIRHACIVMPEYATRTAGPTSTNHEGCSSNSNFRRSRRLWNRLHNSPVDYPSVEQPRVGK